MGYYYINMDYKQALGILAILIGIIAYIPYLIDLFKGKTKPHAFSWFIWGVISFIGIFASLSKGGGAGVWVEYFVGSLCFFIAIYASVKGERKITLIDWLSLAGAILALGLWAITREPLTAILLIVVIDVFGFVPTFRKSYGKPYEETLTCYLWNGIKFIPALFALTSFNLTTALYPAYLIFANLAFVAMLMWRRKIIARTE
jgi:hypothetical protein